MKRNISRCLERIKIAIRELNREIELHDKSLGNVSNPKQLKKIHSSLKKMLDSLDDESFSWEYVGFGRLIIDSWPMDSNLGIVLLEAEQEYKKLL